VKPAGKVAVLAAGLLFGGVGAAVAEGWDAGGGSSWGALLAAARAEGPIVGAMCPLFSDAIVHAFKVDTGIDVVLLPGSITDQLARYRMELKSGRVATDFHLGGVSDVELARAGYLEDISANLLLPDVADGHKWQGGAIDYVDNTKKFMPLAGEYVSTRPVVNTGIVPAESLKKWGDLLKPEFDGKIAVYDPTIPGAGQAAGAYLSKLFGEDFVVNLISKQHVGISRDSQQLADWVSRGLYPIVLGIDSTYIDSINQNGFTAVKSLTLEDGPGSLVGGCGVLDIPKNAPHLHGALVFANWYLSQRGQSVLVEASHYPTFRLDVSHDAVRPYFMAEPGQHYLDQYTEDWYFSEGRVARDSLANKLRPFIGD